MNRQKELQESTQNLTAATSRYGDLEGEAQRLQASINGLLYEKQRRAELQTAREHTASRYLDLERGLIEPLTEEHAADVEMELVNSNDGLKQVRNVIMALSSQFDYLGEPLERIMRLTDDAEQGMITGTDAKPEVEQQ